MKYIRLISFDILEKKGRSTNTNFRVFTFELKEEYDSSKFIDELTYVNFFQIMQKECTKIIAHHLEDEGIKEIFPEDFFKFFEEVEPGKRQYHFQYKNYSYYYIGDFTDGNAFFNKVKYVLKKRYIPLEEFLKNENPNIDKADSLTSGYVFPINVTIRKEEEKELYGKIKKEYWPRLSEFRVGFRRTRKVESIRKELNQDLESTFFWITKYRSNLFSEVQPLVVVSFSIPIDDKKNFFNIIFHGMEIPNSFPIISEMFYKLVQQKGTRNIKL